MKRKVFFIGTHPSQTTGYSKVVYNICKYMHLFENEIDLFVFGLQRFNIISNHRTDISNNVYLYDVYENDKTDLGFGTNSLKEVLIKYNPHVVLIYNDPYVVEKYIMNLELIRNSDEYKKLNASFKICVYLDQVHINYEYNKIEYINSKTDHVFCFTEFWKQNYLSFFKNPKEIDNKVSVVKHGIDIHKQIDPIELKIKYNFSKDDFIFLNLNRHMTKKRLDISILAFIHFLVKSKATNAYIYFPAIIDDNVNLLHTIYEYEIKKVGLDFAIYKEKLLIGTKILTDELINIVYNISDVGLNSCDGEGFGLCNYEHAAYGKPQIVSNVGGLKDFFNSSNSMICEPCVITYDKDFYRNDIINYRYMGECMIKYYNNKELYNKHSEECKKIPNIYKWDTEVKNMFDVILKL
jgi:hypothetical protein